MKYPEAMPRSRAGAGCMQPTAAQQRGAIRKGHQNRGRREGWLIKLPMTASPVVRVRVNVHRKRFMRRAISTSSMLNCARIAALAWISARCGRLSRKKRNKSASEGGSVPNAAMAVIDAQEALSCGELLCVIAGFIARGNRIETICHELWLPALPQSSLCTHGR